MRARCSRGRTSSSRCCPSCDAPGTLRHGPVTLCARSVAACNPAPRPPASVPLGGSVRASRAAQLACPSGPLAAVDLADGRALLAELRGSVWVAVPRARRRSSSPGQGGARGRSRGDIARAPPPARHGRRARGRARSGRSRARRGLLGLAAASGRRAGPAGERRRHARPGGRGARAGARRARRRASGTRAAPPAPRRPPPSAAASPPPPPPAPVAPPPVDPAPPPLPELPPAPAL